MSESVFRSGTPVPASDAPAEPKAEPVVNTTPGTGSMVDTSDLFATYEEDQKMPYTAKYFGVENVWDKEPTLARDIKEIEGYVRQQVTDKKLANDTKSASKFIKDLERKAGLSTYENETVKIQKLLAYIDFRKVVES